MRAAPAVDYPLSQEGWWRRVAAALGGVVAGVPVAWLASHAAPATAAMPVAMLLAALPAAALGAWVGARVARPDAGSLCWDGAAWARRGPGSSESEPGQPELALDWGDWMLLRWRGAGRARVVCLPLARRELPSHWHLLRVALRARGAGAP